MKLYRDVRGERGGAQKWYALLLLISLIVLGEGIVVAQIESADSSSSSSLSAESAPLRSDDHTPPSLGMTYHEVVKSFGAPQVRREYETRREVVWQYGTKKIFFREGRVIAWSGFVAAAELPTEKAQGSISTASASSAVRDEQSIREVLEEILSRESSSSSSSVSAQMESDISQGIPPPDAPLLRSREPQRDSFTMGEMLVGEALKKVLPD